MRLERLRLLNFRQHADTEVLFRPGLTGIIGPNGSGKSTLLEAIAWAIYGALAARGTNETLRFNRAAAGAPVRVELDFSLEDGVYHVVRTVNSAELLLGDALQPIASGIRPVTDTLTRRLGMTYQEFFNTYFCGQRELQFLGAMRPAERARFLSQVLGYERLRAAQELARERRNLLRAEVQALRSTLGDPEALKRALDEAQRVAEEIAARAQEREAALATAVEALEKQAPVFRDLEKKRERVHAIATELRHLDVELARARTDAARAEAEIAALREVEAKLANAREELAPLASVEAEAEALAALREAETARRALAKQIRDAEVDLQRRARRLEEMTKVAAQRAQHEERVSNLKREREEWQAERDRLRAEWVRDREEAETLLRTLRERAAEVKAQIGQLAKAGPEGVCPTCQRPLREEFHRVMELLNGQLENVVQDGKWWKKRQTQLKREPAALRELEERWASLEKDLELAETELTKAEAAASDLEREAAEQAEYLAAVEKLRRDLTALPSGYDAERHKVVLADLERLRKAQQEAVRLEARLEQRPALEARKAEAEQRAREAAERRTRLLEEREALAFSEEEYARAREGYEAAEDARHKAELAATRLRAELDAARAALGQAQRAQEEYRRRAQEVAERERLVRLHDELDLALGRLRDELNARVRPELAEIAGTFLADLTDGRYNEIEIGDDYEIRVLDDGEPKPVLSGGEEDIVNLVLRLAVSQMIAERAGQALNLLVFDEIFGSLDEARRENVVRLLQRLQGRFEQVILITHIESIREGLDQVIRVRFDERSGTSSVTEERPERPAEEFEPAVV